jgi:Sec-independent protein translocase protein TatA
VSLSEMLFLGLLGLVIFGPKKLAEVSQQAGKTLARLKKMSGEFQSKLAREVSATRSDRPPERELGETGQVTARSVQIGFTPTAVEK